MDSLGIESPASGVIGHGWSGVPNPFGTSSNLPRTSTWSQPGMFIPMHNLSSPPPPLKLHSQLTIAMKITAAGWTTTSSAFGIIGAPSRPSLSRPVSVRLWIVQACKQLTATNKSQQGFHDVHTILRQIDQIRPVSEPPVQMPEMLEICETEGDMQNGGGYFTIKTEGPGKMLVRHEVGGNMPASTRGSIAPGEIGSPIPGATANNNHHNNNMPHPPGPITSLASSSHTIAPGPVGGGLHHHQHHQHPLPGSFIGTPGIGTGSATGVGLGVGITTTTAGGNHSSIHHQYQHHHHQYASNHHHHHHPFQPPQPPHHPNHLNNNNHVGAVGGAQSQQHPQQQQQQQQPQQHPSATHFPPTSSSSIASPSGF